MTESWLFAQLQAVFHAQDMAAIKLVFHAQDSIAIACGRYQKAPRYAPEGSFLLNSFLLNFERTALA